MQWEIMKMLKPNPELQDKDNPEITSEDFDRAIPFAAFAKEHGLKIPKPGDTILVNGKPRVYDVKLENAHESIFTSRPDN